MKNDVSKTLLNKLQYGPTGRQITVRSSASSTYSTSLFFILKFAQAELNAFEATSPYLLETSEQINFFIFKDLNKRLQLQKRIDIFPKCKQESKTKQLLNQRKLFFRSVLSAEKKKNPLLSSHSLPINHQQMNGKIKQNWHNKNKIWRKYTSSKLDWVRHGSIENATHRCQNMESEQH